MYFVRLAVARRWRGGGRDPHTPQLMLFWTLLKCLHIKIQIIYMAYNTGCQCSNEINLLMLFFFPSFYASWLARKVEGAPCTLPAAPQRHLKMNVQRWGKNCYAHLTSLNKNSTFATHFGRNKIGFWTRFCDSWLVAATRYWCTLQW